MGRELEFKYRATAGQLERIAGEFGDFSPIEMSSCYYDTPSGALARRHITLRLRKENGSSVCTVKTPASDGSRGEWETEAGEIVSALPELCKLGCPRELLSLCEEGLEPVCGAEFLRRAKTLRFPEGTLELALDLGVLRGGGQEIPLCEVEVELKEGPDSLAAAFAEALAEKYGLTPEPVSKFRRALALAKGE